MLVATHQRPPSRESQPTRIPFDPPETPRHTALRFFLQKNISCIYTPENSEK